MGEAAGKSSVGIVAFNERNPPLACFATAALKELSVETAPDAKRAKDLPPAIRVDGGVEFQGVDLILRYLARVKQDKLYLYGRDAVTSCQVDQWLAFAPRLAQGAGMEEALVAANDFLSLRTFLVGHALTLADVAVWGQLTANLQWQKLRKGGAFPHLERWLDGVSAHPVLAATAATYAPKSRAQVVQANVDAGRGGGDTGSFIELEGAVKGKVVTRFPPEPSGYLHIGHAKAALMNQHFKEIYDGKLLVRFDDTNPSKEKDEYVENIVSDIKAMGLQYAKLSYTSDYFPQLQDVAVRLIKAGVLFADDTPQEEMQQMRRPEFRKDEAGNLVHGPDGKPIEIGLRPSARRERPIEDNLRIFKEMLAGSEEGQKNCLRFKMEWDNPGNGSMRDPVAYRCNPQHHWRTGDQYKAYPTYDLACPFVDSFEGVTHALRSNEYTDRKPQYDWILRAIQKVWPGLPTVRLWHFSRLAFVNTVLSKRKLTQLVDAGKVEGWDDPRMPTVQGMFRRGLQQPALKEFIVSQGASTNTNLQEWEKLWAVNKRFIDPTAPRYTAVNPAGAVRLRIVGGLAEPQETQTPLHKKNADLGTKKTILLQDVLLDAADAEEVAAQVEIADADTENGKPLKAGEADKRRHVTLMDWGEKPVVLITNVTKQDGRVTQLECKLAPEHSAADTKLKLTWLADVPENKVPLELHELGALITKKVPDKDDEIFNLFNEDSKTVTEAWGDNNMRGLKKGTVIQLERKGYWIVDSAADASDASKPLVLLNIPDGRAAKSPAAAAPRKPAAGKAATSAGKKTTAAATAGAQPAGSSTSAAGGSSEPPLAQAGCAKIVATSPPVAEAAASPAVENFTAEPAAPPATPAQNGRPAEESTDAATPAAADMADPSTPVKPPPKSPAVEAASEPASHPLSPGGLAAAASTGTPPRS